MWYREAPAVIQECVHSCGLSACPQGRSQFGYGEAGSYFRSD